MSLQLIQDLFPGFLSQFVNFGNPLHPTERSNLRLTMKVVVRLLKTLSPIIAIGSGWLPVVDSLNGNTKGTDERWLICRLNLLDIMRDIDVPGEEIFVCETEGGNESRTYQIELSDAFLNEHGKSELVGATIAIKGGLLDHENTKVDYSGDSSILVMEEGSRRRLNADKQGDRSVLVVRVSDVDGAIKNSRVELRNAIFEDSISVATQYSACSFGKLTINKVRGYSAINNGILELQLPFRMLDQDIFELIPDLTIRVQNRLGISDLAGAFDHVMYCLPNGSKLDRQNWIAFAYLDDYRSFFSDSPNSNFNWCTRLTGAMHELAHNLGLSHSGQTTDNVEYGDQTSLMGVSYVNRDAPQMCFNPHKNYLLGWYDDKLLTIGNPSTNPWTGVVFGFVSYPEAITDNNEYVLLKVGDNIFVQFNAATDFNFGTQEYPNRLTVVRSRDDGRSDLLGGLGIGEVGRYGPIEIEVCDTSSSFAKVSVRGVNSGWNCNSVSHASGGNGDGESRCTDSSTGKWLWDFLEIDCAQLRSFGTWYINYFCSREFGTPTAKDTCPETCGECR